MQTFAAPDSLNGETLLAELAAAGVAVGSERPALVDDELVLDVAEGDRAKVMQVLDGHTGAPSPRVANREQVRAAVVNQLGNLRTIRDSSGTLTAANLSNAVRVLARGQIHVIRLLLDEFDAVD